MWIIGAVLGTMLDGSSEDKDSPRGTVVAKIGVALEGVIVARPLARPMAINESAL